MEKILSDNIYKITTESIISDTHFYGINFSEYDFSGKQFIDCRFEKCNLSNVPLRNTTFNNIIFESSKVMGLKFVDINKFISHFHFKSCQISLSSFFGLKLKNISFEDSEVKEVDFTNADLENARFHYCDLEKTIFFNSNLKKTDFTGSYNFSIDPTQNTLGKTKFLRENCIGLLSHLDIIIDE